MATKSKNYRTEVLNFVKAIGMELKKLHAAKGTSLKTIAASSGLSVNSVKSIFDGQTGNIASYDSLARALGSSMAAIASGMGTTQSCVPQQEQVASAATEAFQAVQ